MKVHQILITDDGKIPNELPKTHYNCVQSIKNKYDDYNLYSGEELESFLNDKFDKTILNTYLKFKPHAYKGEVGRSCLLYYYGGIYIDLYIFLFTKLEENLLEKYDFVGFRDRPFTKNESWSSWAIQTSIMYSKPKCKIMEKHIESVVENCKYEKYNTHPLDIAGPLILGKSINKAYFDGQDEKKVGLIGDFMDLTYGREKENLAYVLNDGTLFGVTLKNGRLDTTDILGTNNYAKMYYNRDVYNKDIKI